MTNNKKSDQVLYVATTVLVLLAGCSTMPLPDSNLPGAQRKELAAIEILLKQKKHSEAITRCIELARQDPFMPGLPELQNRVMSEMAELRKSAAAAKDPASFKTMEADIIEKKTIPDTYGVRKSAEPKNEPIRRPKSAMEEALKKKVTLHLDGVNLADFILAVGASEGINIIADNQGSTGTMTVHAEDVPLSEILDYVSRNLGVAFFAGENMIWATRQASADAGTPLETRMYGLTKGISSEELDAGGNINIIAAIDRFVPKVDQSDILFDKKAHVLLVKNTRQNLALIEDIIEKLDVCPPQILIEARFISIGASDLREIGIDWVLNSPLIVTRKYQLQNGSRVTAPRTQIKDGASVSYASFPNASEGLNMTYQGLLTAPMFEAVLHALDQSGKSRTLSVPKVTTVNNNSATMRIGEDFRYFDQFDVQSVPTSVSDAGSTVYSTMLVPVGSPQVEELGIQLGVTPSVGADMKSIMLKLAPEISEFVRFETYQVGSGSSSSGTVNTNTSLSLVKVPIFRRSKIETQVVVQSGETVVMGGLISATETKDKTKIPFLSSLPLIGKLFTRDETEETKRNLLIFVTATMLSERGEDLVPVASIIEETGGDRTGE